LDNLDNYENNTDNKYNNIYYEFIENKIYIGNTPVSNYKNIKTSVNISNNPITEFKIYYDHFINLNIRNTLINFIDIDEKIKGDIKINKFKFNSSTIKNKILFFKKKEVDIYNAYKRKNYILINENKTILRFINNE
jgi:hypothetical protein